MPTDDKPLGFNIDIGDILEGVNKATRKPTRRRTTTASRSGTDMDAALRRAVRAELVDVERALKQLAEEVVRLRKANEALATKIAKLTR
jgi:hypothetical protein